ncbi:hypothetical protein CALVIDRAFT_594475 [Calocera viscosa TUFC12733]|uniref:Uncharacterized protein n=1 Tax=Calocera viscosa (strain TUFC12733) TaxID=1330018 RepID=A0A167SD05_CALVF|nr:hypothetical protein CALVIDRAFT_594475 [Calocera viscosa TUFC12733]
MDKAPNQSYGPPDGPPPDYGPPGYDYGPPPPEKSRSKAQEAGYNLPHDYHDDASSSHAHPRDIGDGEAPEYTEEEAAALWPNMPRAPPARSEKLPLPVAVPQLTGKYDSAFVRAYCAQLQAAGVGMQEWLDFCDGLNIAMVASPPLRVVDKAGMIIGFVPYHWAIIAGTLMQVGAQTAMHVLSKTLSDKFLRRANKEFFGPRGLTVRLCRTEAMRVLVGKDAPAAQQPGKAMQVASKIGMGVENVALRLPIPFAGRIIEAVHKPLAPVDPRSPLGVTQRRMQDLQGFVCPLDFDVPPAKRPEDVIGKMNDFMVKIDNNKALKSQNKAAQKRRLLAIRQGGASAASFSSSSSSSSLQSRGMQPQGYGTPPQGPYGQQGYHSPPPGQFGPPPMGFQGPPPGAYGPPPGAYGPPSGAYGPPPGAYGRPPPVPYGPDPDYGPPPPGGPYGPGPGPMYGSGRHGRREVRHALRQERKAAKWEGRRGMLSSAIGMFTGGDQQQQQPPPMQQHRSVQEVKNDQQMLRAERRAQKGHTRGSGKLARKVMKADRLEYNQTQSLLWIVVLDKELDAQIEGKEVVDNKEDVEYVDESDWDDEIDQEEDEDEAFIKGEKERGGVQNSEEDVMTRYSD